MPDDPQIIATRFARRLAVFYSAIFLAIGIQMPFFPLWLEFKGLNAREIGLVLAAPMVVRIFSIPVATRLADRHQALRAAIIAASWVALGGMIMVGLMEGSVAILIVYSLTAVVFTPLMPLADAYALRGLAFHGRAYGPVRLWGSAAFIVGSLGTGWIIDSVMPRNVIWLMVLGTLATATAALALSPLAQSAPATHGPEVSAGKLLRSPAFLAAVAAAGLIQSSHAVYYGFSTLDWTAAGLDGAAVGVLWAIGVIAEITLFAVSGRLPAAFTPTTLLLLGGAGAVVRWTAMALNPPALALPFLQCLHGLSFGATHLGAFGFLAQAAPPRLAATAQGYLAIVLGAAMALAMGLAGLLYDAVGSLAYAAMAASAAAGGIVAFAARGRVKGGRT